MGTVFGGGPWTQFHPLPALFINLAFSQDDNIKCAKYVVIFKLMHFLRKEEMYQWCCSHPSCAKWSFRTWESRGKFNSIAIKPGYFGNAGQRWHIFCLPSFCNPMNYSKLFLTWLQKSLSFIPQQIRPYVNGALYSILALPAVKEEARALVSCCCCCCFANELTLKWYCQTGAWLKII